MSALTRARRTLATSVALAVGVGLPAALPSHAADLDEILAEDARAPIPMYLYDHTADDGTPGEGFDLLYSRDVESGDRILPGELCAYAPRGQAGADCIDLDPEGFRFRGSSTRYLPKKSFNIRFDDRIQGPDSFLAYREEDRGQSRLNANAMWTDPTLMKDRLSMGMFETLERPGPQTRHVMLHHNEVYEGLHTHVQRIDQNLMADLGFVTGGGSERNNITLVRDEFRDAPDLPDSMFGFDVRDKSDEEVTALYDEWWRWRRLPDEDDTDLSAPLALHRWSNEWIFGDAAAQGRSFAAEFEDTFDADIYLDWLAIHMIVGDVDAFGDDYWLFHNQFDDDPKWVVIPWDKDLTFGSHWRGDRFGAENDYFAYEYEIRTHYDNLLVQKVLDDPTLRARFDARLRHLMDEVFTPEYFEQRTSAISGSLTDVLAIDPTSPEVFQRHPGEHHGEWGRHAQHVQALLDYVDLRYAFLDRRLDPIEGERNTATAAVNRSMVGERVTLTDAKGFTLGWFDVDSVSGQNVNLSLTVEQVTGGDVDREWTLSTDRGRVTGELTLFFRNEIESFVGAPAENWYRERTATGGQWDLRMDRRQGNTWVPLAGDANAISNWVSGKEVAANPSGTVLRLSER